MRRLRPLIVALGDSAYLRMPEQAPVCAGHCVLEPLSQEAASTMAPDEVCDELRNFKKCLVQMYAAQGRGAVFLEVAVGLGTHRRCLAIEAVPLPAADFEAAPAYFRKAISEAASEWAQHRPLIDTSGKGVRRCVPAGFGFFHVEFGLDKGYAHVIEDEARARTLPDRITVQHSGAPYLPRAPRVPLTGCALARVAPLGAQAAFPLDFGRQVLEGMLEAEEAGIPLHARRKLPFDAQKKHVLEFARQFAPFDWTKMLSNAAADPQAQS